MRIKIEGITTNGKALFLAYDQGLEHGPSSDFNDKNVDPLYIIDIAKRGKVNALVFQKGIVEKYIVEIKKSRVPLILKLNGKTSLYKGEPIARQLCSVSEALHFGALAVGYTIYIGSEHEAEMLEEFEKIEKEAHKHGLPVVVWIYPRGASVKEDVNREMISYAARTGLEIGADIVKIKYGSNAADLKWAVKSAGRCKVVVAGGMKTTESDFLQHAKDIMQAGAAGLAVGRNVWQAEKPIELAEKLRKIIFSTNK